MQQRATCHAASGRRAAARAAGRVGVLGAVRLLRRVRPAVRAPVPGRGVDEHESFVVGAAVAHEGARCARCGRGRRGRDDRRCRRYHTCVRVLLGRRLRPPDDDGPRRGPSTPRAPWRAPRKPSTATSFFPLPANRPGRTEPRAARRERAAEQRRETRRAERQRMHALRHHVGRHGGRDVREARRHGRALGAEPGHEHGVRGDRDHRRERGDASSNRVRSASVMPSTATE